MLLPSIETFLRQAPVDVDAPAIVQAWQRLRPPYDVDRWILPLPPWARRPYTETGIEAWATLQRELSDAARTGPMCIYVHVPFCASKCGFCDSYSFKLGTRQAEQIDGYVQLLQQELALWREQGILSQRPISTVHFGGGTPAFLGCEAFTRLVETCTATFRITNQTEWALESTVAALTPDMIAQLHALGFRRLHVGVQTLEDPARAAIGRRRPGSEAISKIEEALARGWIVSVDLICGLPGQSLTGFLDGLRSLIGIGVDGFSLYELLIYPQNHRWAESYGLTQREHLPNFLMFQAGATLLERHGYRKNLFNHWANSRDDDRYFTFPTRDEDLLALGTIADGVFGSYHYRHPRYATYCRSVGDGFPGLEGGLRRTGLENRLRPLTAALLSGRLAASVQLQLVRMTGLDGAPLLAEWLDQALVTSCGGRELALTASGSWFVGNMIRQIEQAAAAPMSGRINPTTPTAAEL